MEVGKNALEIILSHAHAEHPREACGILFGDANSFHTARPTRNVHPEPHNHFEIDPQALIDAHRAEREGGPRIAGYYHSHPQGEARPSATDRASAARDGKVWAIVAGSGMAFWRDDEDGFTPLSYIVDER